MPARKRVSKEDGASAQEANGPKRGEARRKEEFLSREQILRKYWDLANLDPEVTKGNITGQLKALDSLREELVLPRPGIADKEKVQAVQEIYQSAWLRTASTRSVADSTTDE
jgi:hypothetical protein